MRYRNFPAENECNSAQKATCDGGSGRASCAVSNGDVYCSCPSGFALAPTKYCIGTVSFICVLSVSPGISIVWGGGLVIDFEFLKDKHQIISNALDQIITTYQLHCDHFYWALHILIFNRI